MRAFFAGVPLLLLACNLIPIPEPGAGSKQPARLAFGLSSYMTPDEAQAALRLDSGWSTARHPVPRHGRCPRFDETNVVLARFDVGGAGGSARLDFINDKLFSILVYPDDFDAFVASLRSRGAAFSDGGEFEPSPGVRVHLSPKHSPRKFVAWTDTAIQRQIRHYVRFCA